jgi:hypothetical protein
MADNGAVGRVTRSRAEAILRVPAESGLESVWTWLEGFEARLRYTDGVRLSDAWLVEGEDVFIALLDGPEPTSFEWLLEETARLLNLPPKEITLRSLGGVRDRWAFRGEAATPDHSRRNPRPVRWERIDIAADDRTLRIEFVHGVVDGLHHLEIYEDDEEVRVTVVLGHNNDYRGGGYVLVGMTAWTTVKTDQPIGRRYVNDGANLYGQS